MDKSRYEKFKNLFIARYMVQKCPTADRLVLTEGGLDNRFFANLNCNNIKFESVNDIMGNDKKLSQDVNRQSPTKEKDDDNHKGFLKELFSESFLNPSLKNTIDKLNVIGIIDKDFDKEYPYGRFIKIISNDTHDLETMILRGDNELLEHISNTSIDSEVVSKAKFMAYKLSLVYLILKNIVSGKFVIKAKYYNIEKYFDGINLNVQKYFDYLVYCYKNSNNKDEKSIMNDSIKLYAKFEQALEKEKHLSKEFKMTYEQFLRNEPKEVWQRINGHDISQIILYFNVDNPRFEKCFFKKKKFEAFLIDNYNYNNFKNEPLYDKMKSYKILN